MTNKEQAQVFWAIMTNAQLALDKRLAAQADLLDVKKTSKVSWEKLGIAKEVFEAEQLVFVDDWVEPLSETVDYGQDLTQVMPIQAAIEAPIPAIVALIGAPKPKKKSTKPSGDQRGLISAKIRCLLMDTDDAYKLIVEAVKAQFPEANTTTRSVASVAAELRKDNVKVAFRRPAKGTVT